MLKMKKTVSIALVQVFVTQFIVAGLGYGLIHVNWVHAETHEVTHSLFEAVKTGSVQKFKGEFQDRFDKVIRQHPDHSNPEVQEKVSREILNERDSAGMTSLSHAILLEHSDIASFIIRHLNSQDLALESGISDYTYLQAAVMQKNADIVGLLVEKLSPAELNAKNKNGRTALILAVDHKFAWGVDLISSKLSAKEIGVEDSVGKSAQDYAKESKSQLIFEIINRNLRKKYPEVKRNFELAKSSGTNSQSPQNSPVSLNSSGSRASEQCKHDKLEVHKAAGEVIPLLESGLRSFKKNAEKVLAANPKYSSTALMKYLDENKDLLSQDSKFNDQITRYIQGGIQNSAQSKLECKLKEQSTSVKRLKELILCFKDKTDEEILFHTWGDRGGAQRGQFNSYIDLITTLIDTDQSFLDTSRVPPFPNPKDLHAALLGILSRTIGGLSMLNGTLSRARMAQAENSCELEHDMEHLQTILGHLESMLPQYVTQAKRLGKKGIKRSDRFLLEDIDQVISSLKEILNVCKKANHLVARALD